MLDKFKTLLSDNKDVKEEEFEASQLAVASLMVTTALHDGEFDEIEKDEILKLLGNFYKLDNDKLNKLFEASFELVELEITAHFFSPYLIFGGGGITLPGHYRRSSSDSIFFQHRGCCTKRDLQTIWRIKIQLNN